MVPEGPAGAMVVVTSSWTIWPQRNVASQEGSFETIAAFDPGAGTERGGGSFRYAVLSRVILGRRLPGPGPDETEVV